MAEYSNHPHPLAPEKEDIDVERDCLANHNTLVLFEMYWVHGMSTSQIGEEIGRTSSGVVNMLQLRGIPRRTAADAKRFTRGDVSLSSLRWRYLSPFQHALAVEIEEDAIRNGGETHD